MMNRHSAGVLLYCLLPILLSGGGCGDSPIEMSTGTIAGHVSLIDKYGVERLDNSSARVSLVGTPLGVACGPEGEFFFNGLPKGVHRFRIEADGYGYIEHEVDFVGTDILYIPTQVLYPVADFHIDSIYFREFRSRRWYGLDVYTYQVTGYIKQNASSYGGDGRMRRMAFFSIDDPDGPDEFTEENLLFSNPIAINDNVFGGTVFIEPTPSNPELPPSGSVFYFRICPITSLNRVFDRQTGKYRYTNVTREGNEVLEVVIP